MVKCNIFKTLCVAAALLLCTTKAQAQLDNSVFLGGSLPVAQFHAKANLYGSLGEFEPIGRTQIGTNAAVGLALGYRASYRFDIGVGEVAPFVNVDLMWNQMRRDTRSTYNSYRCSMPNYINLPIMVGINYRYEVNEIVKVFGEFGVGCDMLFTTSDGWRKDNSRPYYKYKPSAATTWQIGAGAYLGEHVSAGLHYYGLGKHNFDYRGEVRHTDPRDHFTQTVVSRNLGVLMLRVGFHI